MDMQESKFIYETRPFFIFILNVAKDVEPTFGESILTQIIKFFEDTINKLDKQKRSSDMAIVNELKITNFNSKLDYFINSALLNDYFASPMKILDEIELFLIGLFGSVGAEIVNEAINKVCKRRDSFKKENLAGLISVIGESLSKKMRSTQVEMIIHQLKETFLRELK